MRVYKDIEDIRQDEDNTGNTRTGKNLVTEGSLEQGLVDGSLKAGGGIPNITN